MDQKLFNAAVAVSRVLAEAGIGGDNKAVQELREVLRTCELPRAVAYEGHPANGGGIQKHSIGDIFPWDIIAQGTLQPVEWRAVNHNTGQKGPLRSTIGEARADVDEYIARAKIVAAIQRRGGIHVWSDVANDPTPGTDDTIERRVEQRRVDFAECNDTTYRRQAVADRRATLHSSERTRNDAITDAVVDHAARIQ